MNKPTIHTDCFAYNESDNKKEQCCALTERICNHSICRFYKSTEDVSEGAKQLIEEQRGAFKEKGE